MNGTEPGLLIGGEFRTASLGQRAEVVNPCTEEVLWSAPSAGREDVAEAPVHARAALRGWSAVHGWERAKVLRGIARAMERRKDEIAPQAHSERMEKALKAAGVPVETLYVRTEGHGFYSEANRRTYYTRLLDFLSRHLGGAKAK